MNKFLVILCAHVETVEKKNVVLETISSMNNEGIDVCYLSHTNLYLDEISEKVKFCYYDSNNEYLERGIYLENADLLADLIETNMSYFSSDFGTIIDFIPGSPHTRSALRLFKNGTNISYSNFYDWTIYMEYDLHIPTKGFKHFFDSKIKLLVESNKKCFYYRNDEIHTKYLWGGLFIYKTVNIYENSKLTLFDWSGSSRKWVEAWGLGVFESIVESIIKQSFSEDEIIVENIRYASEDVWNISNYGNLGRFSYYDSPYSLEHVMKIGIFPFLDGSDYELNLFISYRGILNDMFLTDLIIKNEDMNLFNLEGFKLYPQTWNIWKINYYKSETIYFEYTIVHENFKKTYKQKFETKNLKIIHDKLNRIEK